MTSEIDELKERVTLLEGLLREAFDDLPPTDVELGATTMDLLGRIAEALPILPEEGGVVTLDDGQKVFVPPAMPVE